jgi:hypothetical protein
MSQVHGTDARPILEVEATWQLVDWQNEGGHGSFRHGAGELKRGFLHDLDCLKHGRIIIRSSRSGCRFGRNRLDDAVSQFPRNLYLAGMMSLSGNRDATTGSRPWPGTESAICCIASSRPEQSAAWIRAFAPVRAPTRIGLMGLKTRIRTPSGGFVIRSIAALNVTCCRTVQAEATAGNWG